MTVSMQKLMTHKRVLLLQGKMGTFFHRFATFLKHQDIDVYKINFNAGDALFYRHAGAVSYTGSVEDFSPFLDDFINTNRIEAVVCFGDSRPHHRQAAELCEQNDLDFFVFEEGYLRPDYITFQEEGINGYSRLDFAEIPHLPRANDHPLHTNNRFYHLALATIIYYIADYVKRDKYPHYRHYRGMSAWKEAGAWLSVPYKKFKGYLPDKQLQKFLETQADGRYFLVSLQVHNDSQIIDHSPYADVKEFIAEVIKSFAAHADPNHLLVFKHHPLDRGHRNYARFIADLANQHGMSERVFYGCDMHLPTLIRHSLGMVTVNSTTGLQSIYHKRPTKVMGKAIYNVPKLTDQKPLAKFWQNPQKPNNDYYLRFREFLIEQTQLNGSFFGKSPWMNAYKKRR